MFISHGRVGGVGENEIGSRQQLAKVDVEESQLVIVRQCSNFNHARVSSRGVHRLDLAMNDRLAAIFAHLSSSWYDATVFHQRFDDNIQSHDIKCSWEVGLITATDYCIRSQQGSSTSGLCDKERHSRSHSDVLHSMILFILFDLWWWWWWWWCAMIYTLMTWWATFYDPWSRCALIHTLMCRCLNRLAPTYLAADSNFDRPETVAICHAPHATAAHSKNQY